jgi:hypothetical protein
MADLYSKLIILKDKDLTHYTAVIYMGERNKGTKAVQERKKKIKHEDTKAMISRCISTDVFYN